MKNENEIVNIAIQLFNYLKYSGTVIVYSKNMEILVALEKFLFENKLAIDTKIHETILREYQVLPKRTHPMMNNKGYSNYVLTCIKIYS